jgi:methylated-DNA-[protein]-cysteine S-methyltransferase
MQFTSIYVSPIGKILIAADDKFVKRVEFIGDDVPVLENENGISIQCRKELADYFIGKIKSFTVRTNPDGTVFQKSVWTELSKINYGVTASYLQIAKRLGDEKTIRAAANANGKNPVAIIIPCHRVIGSNGSLTGYAGGLWRKKFLLEHEGVLQNNQLALF